MTQAIQTIERRVNELGVSEPSRRAVRVDRRPDHRAAARASTTSTRAKNIIGKTARARDQARRRRARARRGDAAAGLNGARCRPTWRSCRASRRPGATRRGALPGSQGAGGDRPRPAQRPADARRVQPAGRQLHAEQRGRGQVQPRDRRQRRPAARDRARQPRAVGAASSRAGSAARGPHHGHASRSRRPPTCRWCCGRARCRRRSRYLEQREVGPTLGARLDPRRRHGVARRASRS